uniref:hypothetical protein n=1 Tax=Gemmiger formicilis TaxID=745368 RepID=UPI003FEE8ED4
CFLEIRGSMASVFVLLEAFNRKEAAALGFFPCATASFLCGIVNFYTAFYSAAIAQIVANLACSMQNRPFVILGCLTCF